MASCIVISTFVVRILFGLLLLFALITYITEFATDQEEDLGKTAKIWHNLVTKSDPRYPGHRNDAGYIIMFHLILLVTCLLLVAAYFEHILMLYILLPCYVILVGADFYLLGLIYLRLKFWFGYAGIVLASLALISGVAFVVLLIKRGPSVPLFDDDDDTPNGPSGAKPPPKSMLAAGTAAPSAFKNAPPPPSGIKQMATASKAAPKPSKAAPKPSGVPKKAKKPKNGKVKRMK